jgi:signal transduction histidine kinase
MDEESKIPLEKIEKLAKEAIKETRDIIEALDAYDRAPKTNLEESKIRFALTNYTFSTSSRADINKTETLSSPSLEGHHLSFGPLMNSQSASKFTSKSNKIDTFPMSPY